MTGEITTYVKYLSPGTIVAEETIREVTSRDPQLAARKAPAHAFGFTFFDRVIIRAECGEEMVTTRSAERNVSPVHYIDAEVLDAAAVEALPGDHKILLSNMRGNGWDRMVRCRTGWFQPLGERDVLVSTS